MLRGIESLSRRSRESEVEEAIRGSSPGKDSGQGNAATAPGEQRMVGTGSSTDK